MGYVADLNSCETLLKIVHLLPGYLRGKWVDQADRIIEQGSEPNFSHLTKFVKDRARAANTLYGKELNKKFSMNTGSNNNKQQPKTNWLRPEGYHNGHRRSEIFRQRKGQYFICI